MSPKMPPSLTEYWVVPVPLRGRVRMEREGMAELAELLEAVRLLSVALGFEEREVDAAAGTAVLVLVLVDAPSSFWKSQGLMY